MVTREDPALPPSFAARRFDGICALAESGRVTISRGDVVFQGTGLSAPSHFRLGDASVSEPLLHAPRQFRWPDGSALHVEESAQLGRVLEAAGLRTSFAVRWQRTWPASLVALLLLAVGTAWLYFQGLPRGAEWLADHLGPSLEQRLGEQALTGLDKAGLAPSSLSAGEQAALMTRFNAFERAAGLTSVSRVVFRSHGPGGGFNAFALPGGTVVFLDGLVKAAGSDQEVLLGVLAHEAGHLQQRHMTRALFRGLGGAALAGLLWGDYSSVASNAANLLGQLRYSRDDESAADQFEIDSLRRAGISPAASVRLFTLLSEQTKTSGRLEVPEWFSTHPSDEKRIQSAMQAAESDRAASAPAR